MSGQLNGKPPVSGAGDGCMVLLKTLEREEILELLSQGICEHCLSLLESRAHNLLLNKKLGNTSLSSSPAEASSEDLSLDASGSSTSQNNSESMSKRPHQQASTSAFSVQAPESEHSSWRRGYNSNPSPASVNSKRHAFAPADFEMPLNDGLSGGSSMVDDGLSEDQKERIRFSQVASTKDFVHIERIDGKPMNVLRGLELHTKVFNAEEQKKIVECVYNLQRMGQRGQLRERTYSEPRKWMRGKGRVTIQFGCCYNYAVDKNGNPPGIIRDEEVDSLPPMFKQMIKRMVKWHILPPTCIPNSCIVNIYDEGDCIPPHIDHHDFLRPFCTVSFLTECNILFGSNLKIVGPGEFSGPVSIPLPVGSVLILNGNGADVAKHCVPAVPGRRISITFRKMDDSKLPFKFSSEPELMEIMPIACSPLNKLPVQRNGYQRPFLHSPVAKSQFQQNQHRPVNDDETPYRKKNNSFAVDNGDFPPLGSLNSGNRARFTRAGLRQ